MWLYNVDNAPRTRLVASKSKALENLAWKRVEPAEGEWQGARVAAKRANDTGTIARFLPSRHVPIRHRAIDPSTQHLRSTFGSPQVPCAFRSRLRRFYSPGKLTYFAPKTPSRLWKMNVRAVPSRKLEARWTFVGNGNEGRAQSADYDNIRYLTCSMFYGNYELQVGAAGLPEKFLRFSDTSASFSISRWDCFNFHQLDISTISRCFIYTFYFLFLLLFLSIIFNFTFTLLFIFIHSFHYFYCYLYNTNFFNPTWHYLFRKFRFFMIFKSADFWFD